MKPAPIKEVVWPKLDDGWVVLNVDGSAVSNPDMASFGGLLRDHDGVSICGFHGSIGHSNVLHAELMPLFHGIAMGWELGYKKIKCYTNSLQTIE